MIPPGSTGKAITIDSSKFYPNASGTITLQAGELKIFTGKKVELPVINKDLESLLPVKNVSGEETQKAQKIMRNGQVLILRGNKMYTITGMEVR